MRWLVALFIVPFVFALSVGDESRAGDHPVLYGDMVAFEEDGRVKVFDFSQDEEYVVGPGANPSLFGFGLTYGDAGLVKYVNVRERNVVTIGQGVFPSIYAGEIVFSAKESQLGDDFSNDSDRNDDIIQEYDVKKAELKNLKVVGKFPVANQRYIVFVTEESQVGVDLNADGDRNDGVLRIFDRESRGVSNAKIEGRDLSISRAGTVAFISQGKLAFMDARSQKSTVTDIEAEHPSIHDDTILFSKGGKVFGYSITSGELAQVTAGESPSLFGESAAIVSGGAQSKMIQLFTDVDADKDGVSDFIDNCPELSGTKADADKDGVGDSCGTHEAVSKPQETQVQEVKTQAANESQTLVHSTETSEDLAWYWYVLIIAAVVIVGPYAWKFAIRYYRKRKKSFGF